MQTRKTIFAALALALMGATFCHATVLPDACGDDSVKFKVKVPSPDESGDYPEQPEKKAIPPIGANKARIVFIQITVTQGGLALFGMHTFTTRFGLNGSWIGAAGNNSFIYADVDPGTQHMCASVQNSAMDDVARRMIAANLVTVEAGKTYYYALGAERLSGPNGPNYYDSKFKHLNEDEGKYRVKSMPLSIFTAGKPQRERPPQ